ncbi:MAG: beta-N-acetylhexosaminidase [Deltaproteobacteria bacterium]|nr:beta-N-acetylhexosaminidase [Deltaproteobacteria bacterium]
MVGFDGQAAPAELLARVRAGHVGGAILFARNVGAPEQVADLNAALRGAAPPDAPLLTCVDQEGGRVQRVRAPATEWPPMAALAQLPPAVAGQVGRALGAELAALGFALDFAPVLDVHTNPQNPVIGDRALGTDPAAVAARGSALLRGLHDAGVGSCGKHFPGHGDTITDSHLDLPVVAHVEARLRGVELVPFARAVADGVPMIMTAHVVFPALDPDVPATMSPRVLGLLRRDLGFDGVIVSDDLEMKAVADRYGIEELVVAALRAGCDAFLVCHRADLQERAREALVHAAERDADTRARLAEAAARLAVLRRRFAGARYVPPADLRAHLGSAPHRALAAQLAAAPR